jgi:DNA-binding SARP family transcriptional activator/TolB-like protein
LLHTLRILGGASIVGPDGPLGGRVAQRRHLALLSVLALAHQEGISRDKLIALFWPEAGTERARQYLSISVYVIRQALGQDAILSAGDDLRLNGERLRVDVVDFRSAVQRREIEVATDLYRGPLLDGFHLSDAPDFERWLESERQELEHEFRTALESAAAETSAAGDAQRAVELWRRLASLDPLNTRVALGVMRALAAVGDRTRALQHARVHAALLREELGADPDPEIEALSERLRTAPELDSDVGNAALSAPPAGVPAAADVASPAEVPAPPLERVVVMSSPRPYWRRRANRLAVPLLLIAVVAALIISRARRDAMENRALPMAQAAALPGDARPAVAVLALENLSQDTMDAYLADGVSEEIAARLTRIPWLRVMSRSHVRQFSDSAALDAAALGRSSGVDYLIEGSVRGSGDRVKIGVRLTSTADGFQIWSEEFNGQRDDLLALQEQIAGAVVTQIGGKLYPWDRSLLAAHPTANPAAYEHFLRGNYHLGHRTPDAVRRAIAEYRTAARLDPGFTAALARQAYAYALFPDWGWEYPGESHGDLVRRGLTIADQALRQEPDLAEAWLARGYLLVLQDPYRMRGAPEAFERAIALDPANAEAFHQYGQTLMVLGRDAEAEQAYEQAIALEPQRVYTMVPLFAIHFHRRHFGEAQRWLDRAVAIDSTAAYVRSVRALLRLQMGDVSGARSDAMAALRLDPVHQAPARAMLARVLTREGDAAGAAKQIAEAMRALANVEQPSPIDARFLASALAEMDRADESMDMLERARPQGAWLWFFLQGPDFDGIRARPRFTRVAAITNPMT